MPKVIIQIQGSEETFADHPRDFSCLHRGFLVKGYGLAQGIHHNMAILTFSDVAVDLFTQFFTERSIHIIRQGAQQSPAFGMVIVRSFFTPFLKPFTIIRTEFLPQVKTCTQQAGLDSRLAQVEHLTGFLDG